MTCNPARGQLIASPRWSLPNPVPGRGMVAAESSASGRQRPLADGACARTASEVFALCEIGDCDEERPWAGTQARRAGCGAVLAFSQGVASAVACASAWPGSATGARQATGQLRARAT
jgi:hypothetical protein